MPHKVNPIHFENAEANLRPEQRPAASPGNHVAHVPVCSGISPTPSTLRNIGSAFGYAVVALHALPHGLTQVAVDPEALVADLDTSWEVLAEAVQTVMRKHGCAQPTSSSKL